MSTNHKMTVEVNFDVDESDIIYHAGEVLADRVEKNAWYYKIRENVDAMVLDEVREKVRQRIALALDRGVTKTDERDRRTMGPGPHNAQTGGGGDWYETESIDAFIVREVERQVAQQVALIAERAAKAAAQEAVA